MIIYTCDRCGKKIGVLNKNTNSIRDLDNRIPTEDASEGEAERCFDLVEDTFDEAGNWKENDYIHLCRSCTKDLAEFLKEFIKDNTLS